MRILVVEDDKRIADSLRKGLEQESYAVDVCYDGQEGFDMAATEDYDLILLDLMLPRMDGMEICRKLREEENVETPILMLTAKGSVDDRVQGLDIGADDYLPKPFSFEELLARIRALLRRPKEAKSLVIKLIDLELDINNNKLIKSGKEIELSRTEFSLLRYLMMNKGQALSKDQIISHVWDYEADVLPNTVEVYIGYLRNKIGKDIIKTVRGIGYKIEE